MLWLPPQAQADVSRLGFYPGSRSGVSSIGKPSKRRRAKWAIRLTVSTKWGRQVRSRVRCESNDSARPPGWALVPRGEFSRYCCDVLFLFVRQFERRFGFRLQRVQFSADFVL